MSDPTYYRQLGDSPYAMATEATGQSTELSPYLVTVAITNTSGAPECERLVIDRRPGGRPITSDGLRQIPVARLVTNLARSSMAQLKDPAAGVSAGVVPVSEIVDFDESDVDVAVEVVDDDERTGRGRISDESLRRLAEICARAEATRRSYIALAGLEMRLTPDQARQWKRKAIKRGIYTPGGTAR